MAGVTCTYAEHVTTNSSLSHRLLCPAKLDSVAKPSSCNFTSEVRTAKETTQKSGAQLDDLPSFRLPLKIELNRFCSSWGERIPVIDVGGLWSGELDRREKVVAAIGAACARWGFFQVVNHGVPRALINRLQAQEAAFFALQKDVKKRCSRTFENIYGYHDREVNGLESVSNWAEYFDVGPKPWVKRAGGQDTLGGVARWPCELPAFRSTLEEYYLEMERLSSALLSAVLESLHISRASFVASDVCANHNSLLRAVRYPRCSDPDHVLGYNSHTDSGFLSIIQQKGVEGLQVLMDEEWVTIEPKAGHFVVNVGDMLQVLSNGAYRSPFHRVFASAHQARLSSPFFLMPAFETRVAPLESLVSASRPAQYRPVPWGEFRGKRIRSEFGDKSSIVSVDKYEVSWRRREGA